MARSWAEFLGDAEGPYETETTRRGFAARLRDSLSRSRRALTEQISAIAFDPEDSESWERLEEALLDGRRRREGDGRARRAARGPAGRLRPRRGARATRSRSSSGRRRRSRSRRTPSVILVVGVNGTGKTTTIGKLAQKLREHGRSVTVGAADTFRAAAEEQLEVWARRAGANFVGGERGGDPAAVAYDAVGAGGDVVIVDTAGRLHTQTNLMDELDEGAARDREPARGRAARDAARARRDHRPERPDDPLLFGGVRRRIPSAGLARSGRPA